MSISKDVIKQCLISKQREVDEAVIVNRPVEFEENGNYVIVGVRHAGKSYLLYQRVRQLQAAGKGWDEMLFVDFEDERLAEFQTEDFNSLLEAHLELYGKKPIVFLDEVQNIPHWDKFPLVLGVHILALHVPLSFPLVVGTSIPPLLPENKAALSKGRGL